MVIVKSPFFIFLPQHLLSAYENISKHSQESWDRGSESEKNPVFNCNINSAILSIVYHKIIRMIDFTIMNNWTEIDWLNFTSKKFTFKLNWLIFSNSQAFAVKLDGLESIYQ